METNKNLAENLGEEPCFVTRVRATVCLSVCLQTEQKQGRESRNTMETGGTARGEEEEERRRWIRGRDEEEQEERRNARVNVGTGRGRGGMGGGEEQE